VGSYTAQLTRILERRCRLYFYFFSKLIDSHMEFSVFFNILQGSSQKIFNFCLVSCKNPLGLIIYNFKFLQQCERQWCRVIQQNHTFFSIDQTLRGHWPCRAKVKERMKSKCGKILLRRRHQWVKTLWRSVSIFDQSPRHRLYRKIKIGDCNAFKFFPFNKHCYLESRVFNCLRFFRSKKLHVI
jgi:hypothetical protein